MAKRFGAARVNARRRREALGRRLAGILLEAPEMANHKTGGLKRRREKRRTAGEGMAYQGPKIGACVGEGAFPVRQADVVIYDHRCRFRAA